jgi:tRNA1Val (adenine37-N6)-methyltransferase
MPNPYFRFKQFVVQQDRCTMKVCTDSCILGAWTALQLKPVKAILDIGTGTGLLTLMLAQKSESVIDAIESDPESAAQARDNIRQTPWSDRIRVLEGDVRDYSAEEPYDFIITNPPFFESDLHSPVHKKNQVKHDVSLTLDQLRDVIGKNLKPDGHFSILLPYHRTVYFENLATANGFFLLKKLTVRQTPAHAPFRSISLFGNQKPPDAETKSLTIKEADGKYSGGFTSIMRDYYLNLVPPEAG